MHRRDFLLSSAGFSATAIAASHLNGASADTVLGSSRDRPEVTLEKRVSEARKFLLGPTHFSSSSNLNQYRDTWLFSKGLAHDRQLGFDRTLYERLYAAIESNDLAKIDSLYSARSRMVYPIAGNSLQDCGRDATQYSIASPALVGSSDLHWEAAELAWAALCRDIPFSDYSNDATALRASSALNGARSTASAAPTLFQPHSRPSFEGPFISRFLIKPGQLGGIQQSYRGIFTPAGSKYLVDFDEYLAVQNGVAVAQTQPFDEAIVWPATGRHLANIVYRDFPAQYYMSAAQSLAQLGRQGLNVTNPSATFATLGLAECFALLNRVACTALQVCWYFKWNVFRRIRPEEYFGLRMAGKSGDRLTAASPELQLALDELDKRFGTRLLPQVYPEGCPIHPSYPAAHAVVSGACGAILKFCFNGDRKIKTYESRDGISLSEELEQGVRVGDEIDKLMWNVSFGRSFAGIHWRSDCEEGIRLGEQIAYDLLVEMNCYRPVSPSETRYLTFNKTEVVV
jgi:hypothetical protein